MERFKRTMFQFEPKTGTLNGVTYRAQEGPGTATNGTMPEDKPKAWARLSHPALTRAGPC